MLTLKVITEETSKVISGLKKKHFAGAEEAVQKAIELDKKRRETQTKLDSILAESKKYASQISKILFEIISSSCWELYASSHRPDGSPAGKML